MPRGNSRAPGDFFYKEADRRPKSPIADRPSLFSDGNPLHDDQPSIKAMFVYCCLTVIEMITMGIAINHDVWLQSDSGAEAGLMVLRDENGDNVALEGDWKLGGEIVMLSSIFSGIASVIAVTTMCCNMTEYNHRFVQGASILAIGVAIALVGACAGYEMLSRNERYDEKYDTQVDRYRIERLWSWGTSYLAALITAIMSVVAAIAAFCSTPESAMCETSPFEALRHCCCCSQKAHKVEAGGFVMPLSPSKGGHAAGATGLPPGQAQT